jgi:predicted nucleic acid-binding protein
MPILKYLADTNVISDYYREATPVEEWIDEHQKGIAITTFTIAEMRRGIELRGDTKARWELERIFKFIMEDYQEAVLVFDEAAAREWGAMMAGAKQPRPMIDSFIAAIARSCNLTVVTRNEKDFPDCKTVNPWKD